MHSFPISKMKIELPLYSVPPFQLRMLVDTLRTRTSPKVMSWFAGLPSSRQPRSTNLMSGSGWSV